MNSEVLMKLLLFLSFVLRSTFFMVLGEIKTRMFS